MKTFSIHLSKFFAIAFISIFSNLDVNAQTEVSLGAKIGASFSGFRGEDASNINLRKGVAGGLFVNISPVNFLTIQPEILLRQRGAVNENEDFNFKEDVKFGALDIPVLVKLRIPIAKTVFPHIYAGPQFSYAFKKNYSINDLDNSLPPATRQVNLRDVDFAGVFGLGVDVELNHLFITLDFRYGMGALNITTDGDVKLKHNDMGIFAGAGYKF